jgi:hypothetical protein
MHGIKHAIPFDVDTSFVQLQAMLLDVKDFEHWPDPSGGSRNPVRSDGLAEPDTQDGKTDQKCGPIPMAKG